MIQPLPILIRQLRNPIRNGHLHTEFLFLPAYALFDIGYPDLLLKLAGLAVLSFYLLINGIEIEAPSHQSGAIVGITFPVGNQLHDQDVFS